MTNVYIKPIVKSCMPKKANFYASGYDCYANIEKPIELNCRERALIPLGFCMEMPNNLEAVIRPRSGMSSKGFDSAIGTIDCDYRGEVKAIIINNSFNLLVINPLDRICQLVIQEKPCIQLIEVEELSETERGDKGFGSTGK